MLHELATNAAKYGALSDADGCVRLSWSIDGDHLHLRWYETDGPPVTATTAKGFGSRLIAMGLGPSSEVERRYEIGGLKVDMRTPIAELAS